MPNRTLVLGRRRGTRGTRPGHPRTTRGALVAMSRRSSTRSYRSRSRRATRARQPESRRMPGVSRCVRVLRGNLLLVGPSGRSPLAHLVHPMGGFACLPTGLAGRCRRSSCLVCDISPCSKSGPGRVADRSRDRSGSSGACRAPPSHAYDTGSEGSPTCIAARGACSAARSLQPSWSHVGLAFDFCAHSFIQRLSRALCWLIPPPRPRAPVAPRARRPGSRCAVAAPGAGPAVRSPQRTAPTATPARSGAAGRDRLAAIGLVRAGFHSGCGLGVVIATNLVAQQ